MREALGVLATLNGVPVSISTDVKVKDTFKVFEKEKRYRENKKPSDFSLNSCKRYTYRPTCHSDLGGSTPNYAKTYSDNSDL